MTLVDTHCHLTLPPLSLDVDGAIARARERGVDRIVVPSYDRASWDAVLEVAARDGVFAAVGVHPWVAGEPFDPDDLEAALDGSGAVAVGEIGLDSRIDGADPARQEEVLRDQIEVAAERDLPVILHCRGAFDDLARILGEVAPGGIEGTLHAFSRGPDLARRFIGLGLHLSFGGAVTRPRARRARRAAAAVPSDRILLETDAPSIGLEGVEPGEAEPAHVADVAAALADIRGEPVDAVAKRTTENAERLFGIR